MARRRGPSEVDALLVLARSSPTWGSALAAKLGIPTGSLYPALERLEAEGLVRSRDERGESSQKGRPLRRLWILTAAGKRAAAEERERAMTILGVDEP